MTPLDQQYQLFASSGAIKFPQPKSKAWKEKAISVAHYEGICNGCTIQPRSTKVRCDFNKNSVIILLW